MWFNLHKPNLTNNQLNKQFTPHSEQAAMETTSTPLKAPARRPTRMASLKLRVAAEATRMLERTATHLAALTRWRKTCV